MAAANPQIQWRQPQDLPSFKDSSPLSVDFHMGLSSPFLRVHGRLGFFKKKTILNDEAFRS